MNLYKCMDSGSKYCPCNLAYTMDCISCSHLRGEDFCDCIWNGVCILYEKYMKNEEDINQRKNYKGEIIEKIYLDRNLYLLKIKLDKSLIRDLDIIGSYIFIRKDNTNPYYDTPMSIFDLDEEHIYIVYQEIGPKTKDFNKGDILIIKGPYWGGITGEGDLSKQENSSIVIVARGIGQSSILIPIKKLLIRGNDIVLFLDKGKFNSLYSIDYVDTKKIKIVLIDLFNYEDEVVLKKHIQENPVDVVFSAGSDMVHRKIKSIIEKSTKSIKWFVSNNSIICCGEGICGACIRKTRNKDRIKLCKTMIDPRNIY